MVKHIKKILKKANMETIKEAEKLNRLFDLKDVQRANTVNGRQESSAEHSWSAILVAEYFLNKESYNLDRYKVIQHLTFHDLVEIEAGDIPLHKESERANKAEKELAAFKKILSEIPLDLKGQYKTLFHEYENEETPEARFAKAIDKLEPMIHWIKKRDTWKEKNFTEENIRKWKEDIMKEFPIIHQFFNQLIEDLKSEGCL